MSTIKISTGRDYILCVRVGVCISFKFDSPIHPPHSLLPFPTVKQQQQTKTPPELGAELEGRYRYLSAVEISDTQHLSNRHAQTHRQLTQCMLDVHCRAKLHADHRNEKQKAGGYGRKDLLS